MSDTPRTDDQECDMFVGVSTFTPEDVQQAFDFARQLERELNAANDRIQSLIEERDRANRLAEWKWNLRDEFQLLLGTDKIEEGIEAVKELKRRIKRLEEAGDTMDKTAEPFVLDTIDEDIPMSDVGEQYEIAYDSPPTAGDHVAMDRARKDWRKAKEDKP